jgi:hypothetical protein
LGAIGIKVRPRWNPGTSVTWSEGRNLSFQIKHFTLIGCRGISKG